MPQTIQLAQNAAQADIEAALNALKLTGGTLIFPKDATISIAKTLAVQLTNLDIKIDLNGSTLVGTGTNNIFYAEGKEGIPSTVKLGLNADGNATVTYASLPSDIKVGSWIKVASDNALPGDHIDPGDNGEPTRLGQAAQVLAVNGNTVVLKGGLLEQSLYTTNVRASVYATGQFELTNGKLDGGTTDYLNTMAVELVQVRNLVNPQVDHLTLKNGGVGVKVVNNVSADIKEIAATTIGMGVHSATSLNTTVDGLFVEHANHGVSIHGMASPLGSASLARYGADIGLHVTNAVTFDAARSAYDTHSESRNALYEDVLAFDSRMLAGFRGIGNGIKDSAGAGNGYALQFYEYGSGDGRDTVVDNVTARETTNYSFIISNNPLNNVVKNSSFESDGKGYNLKPSWVTLTNTSVAENVTTRNDVLTGTAGSDKLLGGKGIDVINGMAGDDYIWGGAEADTLTGGAGRDRFAYNALAEGGDTIKDFQAGLKGDLVDVSVLAARLGWNGSDPLAAGNLRALGSGANTLVQAKGADGSWTTLATLENVKAASFTAANVQWLMSDPDGKAGEALVKAAGTPVSSAPPAGSAPQTGPSSEAPPVISTGPSVTGYAFVKSDGTAKSGETVAIAVTFSENVSVSSQGLTATLSNGAKATFAYGSGGNTLTFTYKVADGEDTTDLHVAKLDLGAVIIRSVKTGLSSTPDFNGLNPASKLAVDTVAPTTGAVTLSYEDSGIKGDGLTNAKTVTLSGLADAGSKLQFLDGARVLGSAVAGADGKWEYVAKNLADGVHSFSATETDAAGNKGTVSLASTLTIDSKAPGRSTMDGSYTTVKTAAAFVPLTGKAEAAASISVYDNGSLIGTTKADANGDWAFKADGLAALTHRFNAIATDAAGNASAASPWRDVVVDRTAPDTTLTRMSASSDGVQFRGSVNETPSEITVFDNGKLAATVATTNVNWIANIALDQSKVHSFTFQTKDTAGNVGHYDGIGMLGTKGNDALTGTSHDDYFTGNGGTDTFVFKAAFGKDVITDFKAGAFAAGGDILKFDHGIFTSYADFLSDARQVGADVVVTVDDHTSLTLQKVALTALTHDNVLLL